MRIGFSLRSSSAIAKMAWALFAATVLLRLFIISRLTASPYFSPEAGDMKFYNDWALRILHGQWSDGRAFYGLPGYAYLAAAIYKVGGYNPFYLSGLQAIAEGFTALFIFRISVRVFKKDDDARLAIAVGVLAALGYACFIPAQAFCIILMPTSLLVCLFWLTVYWAILAKEKLPTLLQTAALGLAIGAMSMMVATIFFAIPLVVFSFWRRAWEIDLQRFVIRSLAFFAAVLVGASPAILYNRLIAHDEVFLSAHGGLNFFVGNNPAATGYPVMPAGLRAGQTEMLRDSISIAENALRKTPGETIPLSAVSQYWSIRAGAYIRAHPGAWWRLEGQKIVNFWNALQYDDLSIIAELGEGGILLPGLRFGLIAALGLVGLCYGAVVYPRSRWVAAAVLLHMASLLTVFVTERYRLAAAPGLFILSSFLVVELWKNIVQAHWGTAAGLAGATLAATAFITQPVPAASPAGLDSFNIGLHALELGDLPRARAKIAYAWRSSPETAEINFAAGNLALAEKDPQSAKSFYQRTIRLNPRHDGALNNLGVIALDQKMPEIAARFFQKSLEIEPDDAATLYQLAKSLQATDHIPEAQKALVRAIQLRPTEPAFRDLQAELNSKPKN